MNLAAIAAMRCRYINCIRATLRIKKYSRFRYDRLYICFSLCQKIFFNRGFVKLLNDVKQISNLVQ
jgi:hypothetical protein